MRAVRNFILFTVALTLLITAAAGAWMLFFDTSWYGDYLLVPGEYAAEMTLSGRVRSGEELKLYAFLMAMGINGVVAAMIGGLLGEVFGRVEPKPH